MSVIRTLSASETNEQREKERAKLEKEYKKSDARLDRLVAEHASELGDVTRIHSEVGLGLARAVTRGASARARLAASRHLLRVRRDDLRRLAREARAHHHALIALSAAERLVDAEREVRDALARGHVLHAASLLATTVPLTPPAPALLPAVTALDEARADLARMLRRELAETPLAMFATGSGDGLLAELSRPPDGVLSRESIATAELETTLPREEREPETQFAILLEASAILGVLDDLLEVSVTYARLHRVAGNATRIQNPDAFEMR